MGLKVGSIFSWVIYTLRWSYTMTPNVLALGAVADFGAQNCQYTTKVDTWKNLQLTTEPAIEPNACYRLGFCFSSDSISFKLFGSPFCLYSECWII